MKLAVVIGSSMSGMLAARVLADHFDEVILIEHDDLPRGPDYRRGVPQARHLHLLLMKGKHLIEGWFPGITDQLIGDGAPVLDAGSEFLSISPFGPAARSVMGLKLLLCSRVLLEWRVRQCLEEYTNIRFLTRVDVTGLFAGKGNRAVRGVAIRGRGSEPCEQEIETDLVVDVSGRESKSPIWLKELGYPSPPVTVVDSRLGYATRWYRRKTDTIEGWGAVLMNVRVPHNPRAGAILPAENNVWICTLAGVAGNYPPKDEKGFSEFARNLADPIIYNHIKDAEPTTPIIGYRKTANQWRHYEQLKTWPGGFVVIGDAVCAFNPIYGQGMTTGALGAQALADQLEKTQTLDASFGRAFQKKLAKITMAPWAMATGEDYRWPETVGPSPRLSTRIGHWYSDQVLKAATEHADVGRTFLEVVHLLQPRSSMLRPKILVRALEYAFRKII